MERIPSRCVVPTIPSLLSILHGSISPIESTNRTQGDGLHIDRRGKSVDLDGGTRKYLPKSMRRRRLPSLTDVWTTRGRHNPTRKLAWNCHGGVPKTNAYVDVEVDSVQQILHGDRTCAVHVPCVWTVETIPSKSDMRGRGRIALKRMVSHPSNRTAWRRRMPRRTHARASPFRPLPPARILQKRNPRHEISQISSMSRDPMDGRCQPGVLATHP